MTILDFVYDQYKRCSSGANVSAETETLTIPHAQQRVILRAIFLCTFCEWNNLVIQHTAVHIVWPSHWARKTCVE